VVTLQLYLYDCKILAEGELDRCVQHECEIKKVDKISQFLGSTFIGLSRSPSPGLCGPHFFVLGDVGKVE